ncbi:MAG: hypothetical protein ACRD0P_08515, partial [Stackebrandtia sp.]
LILLTACSSGGEPDDDSGGKKEEPKPKASFAHATERELSGTFFYIGSAPDDPTIVNLWSMRDGEEPFPVMSADSTLFTSGNVSPDGTYASWVDPGGKLKVWDLTKEKEVKTPDGAVDGECREPVWVSPTRLLTHAPPGDDGAALFDVTDGKAGEATAVAGCHPRLPDGSEDDSTLAAIATDQQSLEFRTDGKD